MLVTEVQPNPLLPQEVSKKTFWQFRSTSYVINPGAPALLGMLFTNGSGGADGQTFTFGGVEFTTDSALPYTATTFDYSTPDAQQAAENFAGMLRSNPKFYRWVVSVFFSGFWIVFVQERDPGEYSAADIEIDVSGLAPAVNIQTDPGQDREVANQRLWYQFWDNYEPLGALKTASFDATGRAQVDAAPAVRPFLDFVDPYFLWTGPELDPLASRVVILRYGTLNIDAAGNRSFGQAYESAPFTLVNSVRRQIHQQGLRPYSPEYSETVAFLDSRPATRSVYRGTIDFTALWVQPTGEFQTARFRSLITYYLADGTAFSSSEQRFSQEGLYHFPIGPATAGVNPGAIASAAYYTLVVQIRNDDADPWEDYSETRRFNLVETNCFDAELIYLSDLGAWQSLQFEYLEGRRLETAEVTWAQPVETNPAGYSPNPLQLFADGGRNSAVETSDEVLSLASFPVTDRNRYELEQLLLSPRVFLVRQSDPFKTLRRVLVNRSNVQTFTRGEVTRVVIDVRFSDSIRTRW